MAIRDRHSRSTFVDGITRRRSLYLFVGKQASAAEIEFSSTCSVGARGFGGREHSAHGASYSYDESIDSQKNEALSGTREFAAMPQMERPIPSQHGLAAV